MADILIIDDSLLVRRLACDVLVKELGVSCHEASTLKEALSLVKSRHYEVVLLDYVLPDGNGLELLKRAKPYVTGRVLLFSSLAEEGAEVTLKALEAGAVDFILKPNLRYMLEQDFARELTDKVSSLLTSAYDRGTEKHLRAKKLHVRNHHVNIQPRSEGVIAVASSMGGPQALRRFFARFGTLGLPVVVAQHMPPGFTRNLAQHIHQQSGLKVLEADTDMDLKPETVYVVAGGKHGAVEKGRLKVFDGPPVNGVKPAADVLFYSCAESYGKRVVGVVLTGMGKDGLDGSKRIKEKGGTVLAESKDSAAVWGMPGEVVKAGFADFVGAVDVLPEKVKEVVESWS
ncbi:response regulator [Coprothermobacteraceae bacterium]|nr:response regulator [Coprothermobacteraceae bacterium]